MAQRTPNHKLAPEDDPMLLDNYLTQGKQSILSKNAHKGKKPKKPRQESPPIVKNKTAKRSEDKFNKSFKKLEKNK